MFPIFAEAIPCKEWTDLIHEVNSLKIGAMLFIIGLVFTYALYLLIKRRLDQKEKADLEAVKTQRAEEFKKTFNKLANAMTEHTQTEEALLKGVGSSMEKVNLSVASLVAKSTGQISREDSILMIRDRFIRSVYRDFCSIVERSLTHNDYKNNSDNITRKVKTAMRNVLVDAQQFLSNFNLSVDPRKFFIQVPNQPMERYILCDMIWAEVEPLYTKRTPVQERIEEAFLVIENVINDYLTTCGRSQEIRIGLRDPNNSSASLAGTLMKQTTRLMEKTHTDLPDQKKE